MLCSTVYVLGVQFPTFAVNVPLNNRLQALDPDANPETERRSARADFETRWNRSNQLRTALAVLVTVLLAIVRLRMG